MAALWRSWGVEPAAVFGHSAGELAASYISGALSLEDAVLVAFHRSRLQQRMAGQGTMLAAGISRAEAMRLVERHPRAISIAAVNSPGSVTLSGDASVLAEIDRTLNEAGQFSRILQVDVPYHSPKMEQFESEAAGMPARACKPLPASTPFFSTVTGAALTGSELNARYWYRNMRQPVLFLDVMRELVKAGHRVFLEDRCASHPEIRHRRMPEREVVARNDAVLAAAGRSRARGNARNRSAGCYTLGAEIDWQKLFPAEATAIKLPRYPFQAESHWRETDQSRVTRLGQSIHPCWEIGSRHRSRPGKSSWISPAWDTCRIIGSASSIVFPGAGYVEMALAVGREMFGPVPCVLEDIEFSEIPVPRRGDVLLRPRSCSIPTRASSASTRAPMHPTIPGICMRAVV